MINQEEYKNQLEKYAQNRANDKNSVFSSKIQENYTPFWHIMLIEEKKFASVNNNLSFLSNEDALLEKVDLIDYWIFVENGRTNQTR